MANFLDIIEWFDDTGEEIVHRIPESGSAETKYGSQVIVRENQAAVFFRDGKALDVFGPGRHTLSTQNIPLLTKFLTKMVGFGEKSPFRVEIVYVNLKVFTKMKWGTKEPVPFRDTELGVVRLRAFGNFVLKIKEPQLFVNTIVGTQGRYTSEEIEGYLRDVIVARFNDLLGENVKSVFDLAKVYDELAVALKMRLADDFGKYGAELVDIFIQTITPPEEVQKMIDERSGMGVVGDMNKFMQFQAAKSMRDAARGGEGGGGTAAAGMGVGVGAGLGMMMPGMVLGAMQAGQAQPAGAAAGAAAAAIACPKCSAWIPAAAKFCPGCGEKVPVGKACPGCGKETAPGANFCPECGQSLQSAVCPQCKKELAPGAKFCPECGAKSG
jgi:membrane protease subunit (stomatin/prohibitin family)